MFRIFVEEKVFSILMLAGIVISIFLRVLLGLLYRKMIKEADNMAITDNKMLKQCKLKFANCYQLGNGVANIPVFVDKFLNRLSLGPLSFEMMYHLSGQAILLSVVFAGVGICRCIMRGWTLGEILPFYIVSFMGLYLYFSVSTVVDVRGKKRILKVNLVDYLENHLSPRINVTREDMEMLYGEAYEYGCGGVCEAYGPAAGYGGYRGNPGVCEGNASARRRGGACEMEKKRGTRGRGATKQIAGPKESRSSRKARSKGGVQEKRTVELMPIGNRLATVPEREEYPEGMQAGGGSDREAYGRVRPAGSPEREDARKSQAPGQEESYRRKMQETNRESAYVPEPEEDAPEAEKAWYMQEARQEEPEYTEGRSIDPEDSAQVTEEELEALLKEFLAT